MTPKLWQQITEIFHDALEHDIEGREAYLHEACWHDSAFRTLYLDRKPAPLSVAHPPALPPPPRGRHRGEPHQKPQ